MGKGRGAEGRDLGMSVVEGYGLGWNEVNWEVLVGKRGEGQGD